MGFELSILGREVGRRCFQHDLVGTRLELDGLLEAQRAGAHLDQIGTGCGASSLEQTNTEPLALDGSLDPGRNVQPLFADDLALPWPVHLDGRRLGHEAEPMLVREIPGGLPRWCE